MTFKKQKASRLRRLNVIFAVALKRMVFPKLYYMTVVLIVCEVFSKANAKQCSVGEVSKFGMMLQRHIFKSISGAAGGYVCYRECIADIRCQSFNYVFTQKLCELNNRTKEARPDDYVPNPERYYFKRDLNRVALGSIPELAVETCQEIKMSEGGQAVSGKYWFSSIVPERTVLAPCDMKTEDVNECNSSIPVCDVNAKCVNTIGSYSCWCKASLAGNGKGCIGFRGFPLHLALNGSDPYVSLYNGASYRNIDGRTVLYLNGTQHSYAETPALPLRTISFSIMCWIKVLSRPSSDRRRLVHIYSDWSEPRQFKIFISKTICAALRNPQRHYIVYVCRNQGKNIILQKWMHVAFAWSRDRKEGILYIDGIIEGNQTVSNDLLDLIENNHTVFDIGLKRDSMDRPTFDGYMRDLFVVDKALSGEEVKHLKDIF